PRPPRRSTLFPYTTLFRSVQMLVDDARPDEVQAAEALNRRLVRRALDADGTCTGEHGIGLHKQDSLVDELGPLGVDLMRRIKTRSEEHTSELQSRENLVCR